MITKSGENVFQTPNLIHTSEGVVKGLKVEFPDDGSYTMSIDVEGILFSPIPPETVSFDILVGDAHAQPIMPPDVESLETQIADLRAQHEELQTELGNIEEIESLETQIADLRAQLEAKKAEGGGCLIATAAFGSELAPQVQQLRELRDNTILSTESGTAFMSGFNQLYYSFSPMIADLERESPIFKEVVKITLTPMLSSLSLLNYVDIDSEQEMLGYGISLILLNIGMYAGIPAFAILKLYQFRKN